MLRVLCFMIDSDHFLYRLYMCRYFLYLCLSYHFVPFVMNFWTNMSLKVWASHICTALGDYMCLMYEFINFKIVMEHFMVFHNVTCYPYSLNLSQIHVNTQSFFYTMHFACHMHDIMKLRVYQNITHCHKTIPTHKVTNGAATFLPKA